MNGWLYFLTALAAAAALAGAYQANPVEGQSVMAARKTAAEIRMIQKAASRFENVNGAWPSNLTELKSAGYLPPHFPENNSWGGPYTLSPSGDYISVATPLPAKHHEVTASLLPNFSESGDLITSRATKLGMEPVFSKYLKRVGDEDGRTMEGNLIMNNHRVRDAADAIEDSDGLPLDQADSAYVLTAGDVMTGDLYANKLNATRFEDSDNPVYHFDPGGGSNLNRILVNDIFYPHLGKYGSELLDRPSNWDCYIASSVGPVCCSAGYAMIDTAGAGEVSQGCNFFISGGSQCGHCQGPTYAVCCR